MSIAMTYARAFHEIVGPAGEMQARERTELSVVVELLKKNELLRRSLVSPLASAQEKGAIVKELSAKVGFSEKTTRFLDLLAKKGRLALAEEILAAFDHVTIQSQGGVFGEIVSAEPMGHAEIRDLEAAFSRKLGKRVVFRQVVRPELLAGLKVTVAGVTYDGTLKTQVELLKERFIRNA